MSGGRGVYIRGTIGEGTKSGLRRIDRTGGNERERERRSNERTSGARAREPGVHRRGEGERTRLRARVLPLTLSYFHQDINFHRAPGGGATTATKVTFGVCV